MKDEDVVGQLTIKIAPGEVELVDGNEHGTFVVEACTKGGTGQATVSQTIKSKITDDLNLIKETKIEDTYLSTKTIETQYIPQYGEYSRVCKSLDAY